MKNWRETFRRCLETADPEGYLVREILNFKADGGRQVQAEEILSLMMADYNEKKDKEILDVLEDVSCAVAGYCSSSNHLFREDFIENDYYRQLPR